MNDIIFDAVKYINDDLGNTVGVNATKDGVIYGIPLDPANRHYAEILRQVADGTLTIADAD
jgi:hypothetical protein